KIIRSLRRWCLLSLVLRFSSLAFSSGTVPQIFYTPVLREDVAAVTKGCPVRWEFFKGKCYFFPTTLQTWNESQKICAEFSSHLAVVNSEEELVFLKSRTQLEKYFIGLTQKDGRWSWIDGTAFDHNIFSLNLGSFQCAVVGFGSTDRAMCSVSHRCICEKNA
ncbi:PREDICTED: C-type lectin domain family 5 member A-like, partial [Gekko japonicus]|uniref:C-type lectin domain family 5 member A-like n=1 Tax=Gekko japonicus TaxID=146911 RepID=A0ABM1JXG0_GEKJA